MDGISWADWATRQDEPTLRAARILWRGLGPLTPVRDHPTPVCVTCGGLNGHRYGEQGRPQCMECRS
jgi:hypothetical protein